MEKILKKINSSKRCNVKRFNLLKRGKIVFLLGLLVCFVFWGNITKAGLPQQVQVNEQDIKKAKIFQDVYPLISESDLYCSFFILDEEMPEIQIIGAEREYERNLLNNGDVIYIDKGKRDGIESGHLFLILEVGSNFKGFGPLSSKRGRARILHVGESRSSARIEKSCGQVMVGQFLVPFQDKESIIGKDLGYDISPLLTSGIQGNIIYLDTDINQIARGQWALVDLGQKDGIQAGDQLIAYRQIVEGGPLQIIGNVVVIDSQKMTSTIKVLSCKDVLRIGDRVQTRPVE